MSLSERLNEHPILNWISENTKNFIYLLLIILAMGVLTYRMLSYWSSQTGYHYSMAENSYYDLQKNGGEADQLLALLAKQPDLQAVYDGKLGQLLLAQGDKSEALPLIERAAARTEEENSPLFVRYAQNTLLIAKEDYAGALKGSQELAAEGTLLFPVNMLRIAMLEQKLGLKEEELATWQKWKENSSNADFQRVASLFREKKVDLNNYIETREKLLK